MERDSFEPKGTFSVSEIQDFIHKASNKSCEFCLYNDPKNPCDHASVVCSSYIDKRFCIEKDKYQNKEKE